MIFIWLFMKIHLFSINYQDNYPDLVIANISNFEVKLILNFRLMKSWHKPLFDTSFHHIYEAQNSSWCQLTNSQNPTGATLRIQRVLRTIDVLGWSRDSLQKLDPKTDKPLRLSTHNHGNDRSADAAAALRTFGVYEKCDPIDRVYVSDICRAISLPVVIYSKKGWGYVITMNGEIQKIKDSQATASLIVAIMSQDMAEGKKRTFFFKSESKSKDIFCKRGRRNKWSDAEQGVVSCWWLYLWYSLVLL